MKAHSTRESRTQRPWTALGRACLLTFVCASGIAAQSARAGQEPAPQGQEENEFNPLKAEKNLEVGQYYLKRGNYDAAIDRLKDALKYKSNFAAPHLYLGQAYEKKRRPEEAVHHYERYLEILPSAEDAKKVQKRIAKLKEKMAKKAGGPS
jgi:tetratricopeptide (TPR) repeat protein